MSQAGSSNAAPPVGGRHRDEFRRLWQLGAPVAVTQLGTMLLNVVDTIMVGRLGVLEFDAAALGYIWYFGTSIFAIGLVLGADPIMTQAFGAGQKRRMGLATQRALVVAGLASIPVALSWLAVEPVLLWADQNPAHAAAAARYLAVQIWSIPLLLGFQVLRQYLQAMGRMAPGLWITVVANVFNVAANWALIFGNFGFDAMGLEGAGIATATTRLFLLVGLVAWIWISGAHKTSWVPWSRASIDPRGIADILKVGLPIAVQYGLEGWVFQISGLMAGQLGEDELAAHTVVLSMASTSFMVALGISIGATTRIGNLIGMGEHQAAQRASHVALGMGAGVMTLCGLGFVIFREWLPSLYVSSPTVIVLAASLLPIAAAFQIADGAQVVGGAVLRGMGRTVPAAVFNFIAYYVIALPLSYLLAFRLGWGLAGIWTALAAGLGIVAVMVTFWIRHRGPAWLANEVEGSTRL